MTRPRTIRFAFLSAVLLLLAPAPAAAQSDSPAAEPPKDTVRLVTGDRIVADTVKAGVVDESQWPNPTVTLFKSMLVPGWGQITNRAYVKAAIAIGLETWFITGTLVNWAKANDALDKFRQDPDYYYWYDEYQYYWGQRSDFLWLLGLTVFVSMFDAYVDAHLRPYEGDTIPGVEPPRGLKLVIPF